MSDPEETPSSPKLSSLPEWVDQVADQFEAAWNHDRPPTIRDYLTETVAERRKALLRELVKIDLEYRWKAGQRPRLENYLSEFPELLEPDEKPSKDLVMHARGVHDRYGSDGAEPGAEDVAADGPATSVIRVNCPYCHTSIEVAEDAPLADINCPSCGSRFSLIDEETIAFRPSWADSLGRFEILENLGSGAFGSVWKARDTQLDRIVAVKVAHTSQLDAGSTEQLLREAQAAAQLKHPNIVSVHEIGRAEDTVYIVSDFVDGVSLADWLTGRRFTTREAAKMCAQIAMALDHAHQAGVIHRDLKPSNIMLDRKGEPYITDFGLAKREAGEVSMTVAGKLLGTPAYMSPEQACGEAHHADRRSDVYSLGVILFQLLTGELPFRGSTRMLLHQVIHDEAPSPRKFNGNIPRDLETICLKSLEKVPERRYDSARELAEELGRFLNREPIHARPVGKLERFWRWCRRNPAVATLTTVAALLLVAIASVTTVGYFREARLRQHVQDALAAESRARRQTDEQRKLALKRKEEADEQRDLAEQREHESRRYVYATQMHQVHDAWQQGDLPTARKFLNSFLPKSGEPDLRGFEWYYFWRLTHTEQRTLFGHTDRVTSVAVAPDGNTIATLGRDGTIRLWNPHQGQEILTLKTHTAVYRVVFSPDGATLAVTANNTIQLWDIRKREFRTGLTGHQHEVRCLAYSPDGKTLASGDKGRMIRLWDPDQGKETGTRESHSGTVYDIAFSPDDQTLATAEADGYVELWDLSSQKPIHQYHVSGQWATSVAFSPDGRLLAFATDTAVHLGVWRDPSQQGFRDIPELEPVELVWAVRFSPDGKVLAVASGRSYVPGYVKLWDVATRTEIATLKGHVDRVRDLTFLPDGKTLITASDDNEAKLWDLGRFTDGPREGTLLQGSEVAVYSAAFSPDGTQLATACQDGSVKLWQVENGKELATLTGHTELVWGIAFSPDGKLLATSSWDNSVKLWNVKTRQVRTVINHQNNVNTVAFSPDGQTLAAGTYKAAKLWDVATGRLKTTLSGHSDWVKAIAFSPDGSRLVTASRDMTAKVWEPKSGKLLVTLSGHKKGLWSVAFSADGRKIATSSSDLTVKLWDAKTGKELPTLPGAGYVCYGVAFSPSGDILVAAAAGPEGGQLLVWDGGKLISEEWANTYLTQIHGAAIRSVVFSPDGKTLASTCADGTVKLWDTARWKVRHNLKGHAEGILSLAFSPDGKMLAIGKTDFTARVLDADSGRELKRLSGHTDLVCSVAFSADGKTLATAGYERTVKLWDLATGEERGTLVGFSFPVRTVVFSPDGKTLVTGEGKQGKHSVPTLKFWDLQTQKLRAAFDQQVNKVRAIAFSPDGNTWASVGGDDWYNIPGEVMLWDREIGPAVFEGHHSPVTSVQFSPDGQLLATGSRDQTVKLWNVAALKKHLRNAVQQGKLLRGRYVGSFGHRSDPTGMAAPALRMVFKHDATVEVLAFSPDQKTLAVGISDGTVKLWHTATGGELLTLKAGSSRITSLSFSPDGRSLLAACYDGSLRAWRTNTADHALSP